MDAGLAGTYMLIHSFLCKHSHTKAAQAVKKAAQSIVVLKEDIDTKGPSLDIIIKEWGAYRSKTINVSSHQDVNSSNSGSSSTSDTSDSDSSDSSTSDSSDSTSSDSSTSDSESGDSNSSASDSKSKSSKLIPTKEQKPKKLVEISAKTEARTSSSSSNSDSSSSSSSSSDSESGNDSSDSDDKTQVKAAKKMSVPTKASKSVDTERGSSQTLSSQSSSNSAPKREVTQKTIKQERKVQADSSDTSSSDSSSEPSSDSDSDSSMKLEPTNAKEAISRSSPSDPGSSSDHEETPRIKESVLPGSSSKLTGSVPHLIEKGKKTEAKVKKDPVLHQDETPKTTKKRRTDQSGKAVITATTKTEAVKPGPHSTGHIKANGKPVRKTNAPFQRVNPEKVSEHIVQNNGYIAKTAPENDYGARAHNDLIVTRGAGFRKEKNKKKRGSYKGGAITMESHSFKFTY